MLMLMHQIPHQCPRLFFNSAGGRLLNLHIPITAPHLLARPCVYSRLSCINTPTASQTWTRSEDFSCSVLRCDGILPPYVCVTFFPTASLFPPMLQNCAAWHLRAKSLGLRRRVQHGYERRKNPVKESSSRNALY